MSTSTLIGVSKNFFDKEVIEWETDKTGLVEIYRSLAPHDGFELIDTVDAQLKKTEFGQYSDKISYYKIDDTLLHIGQYPNAYASEIIRRDKWYLKCPRHSGGTKGILWIKNINSNKCLTCWDEINEKRTISNCPDCMGTGLETPYYKPLEIFIGFSPGERFNSFTPYKMSKNDLQFGGWTTNSPLLKPDDVFEFEGNRYRITRVSPYSKVGHFIIRQRIPQVEMIEKHRSEYRLSKEDLVEVLY